MSDPADTPAPRPDGAEERPAEDAPPQAEAPAAAPAEPHEPPSAPEPPQAAAPVEQPAPQAAVPPSQAAPAPRHTAAPPHAAMPRYGGPPLSPQQAANQAAYYQRLTAPQVVPPNPRWHRPGLSAGQTAVLLVTAVALFGAWAAFHADGVGIGLSLTGIALVAVPLAVADRKDLLPRLPGAVLVAALWSVAAIRDAGWVVALCSIAAFALTPVVLAPQRRFGGNAVVLLFGWLEGPAESFRWAKRGRRRKEDGSAGAMRGLWTALVTIGLLVVFGGLFAAADSTFADLVARLLPELHPVEVFLRLMLAAVLFPLALVWAYTAVAKPRFDGGERGGGRVVSRFELAIPLGALNLLFAAFIAVQLRVYVGGEDYVWETAGLTFAEYARQGFWQLSVVAALSLTVIALAAWLAPKRAKADRWTVRLLLGPLCLMSLVVIASALYRMYTYFETFGLTRMRIWVFTVEIWLAVLFALVLVCCWKLRASWLPRAVLASGALTLLGLAAANPDALIARYNIDNDYKLDIAYLQGLSNDAVPELTALSGEDRECVLDAFAFENRGDRDLMAWNLGYQRADDLLPKWDGEWEDCFPRETLGYEDSGLGQETAPEDEATWSAAVVPPDSLFFSYDTCTRLDMAAAERMFGHSAKGDYGVEEDGGSHGGWAFDPAEAAPGEPYGTLECGFFGPGTRYLSIEVMGWADEAEAMGFYESDRATAVEPRDYAGGEVDAGYLSDEFKYMSVIGHLTFEVTILDGGDEDERVDVAADLAEVQLWEYYRTFA